MKSRIVKIFICFYLIVFPLLMQGQTDTILFIGVNGKIENVNKQVFKKEINFRSKKRIKIKTYKNIQNEWVWVYTEMIKREAPRIFSIKTKGETFSENLIRKFEPVDNKKWKFIDLQGGKIKRTGYSVSKIPLILNGKVTEFFPNGNKKSVSYYNNNELINNLNWKRNGEKYIDSVFYSTDKEPRFPRGMNYLHNHILNTFEYSKMNLSEAEGRIVVGFVVMENGEIEGIRIEKGMNDKLNNLVLEAFHTLPGKWEPARLSNKPVRYYQLFPINFIYHDFEFDYVELKGSMLYWEIN